MLFAIAALALALAALGSWAVWDRVSADDGTALVDDLTSA
jgi:hypothetical protein